MRRYFCLVATLALMIPGLARAQSNITAQVGGVSAVSGATPQNFDGLTTSPLNSLNGTSTSFSKVVASSRENAFEFDDVAHGAQVQSVPEPTTRALIACGMGIGFLVLNRKHAKKS